MNDTDVTTLPVVDNHIYFYVEVDEFTCLNLVKTVREVDNKLCAEAQSRTTAADVPIYLHIQSVGGDGWAALAASDQLKLTRSPVVTIVEGICASAATFLAVVGTKRLMLPNSVMLIHQASNILLGTHSELEDNMKMMEMLRERMIWLYVRGSKMSNADVEEMLQHDSWLDSARCVELGLIDGIGGA
jgi:ATP-dependent Clp protease protease subunit